MAKFKNAIKIITALILGVATLFLLYSLTHGLAFCRAESYRFYVGNTSINCREVYASPTLAPITKLFLNDINGESATYKSLDLQSFLKGVNGEIVFEERVENCINYYCKADLPYSIHLYGEEINLHICVSERNITVASPIIFGGY